METYTVFNTENTKTVTLVLASDVTTSSIKVNGNAATIVDCKPNSKKYWIRRPNVAVKVGDSIEMDSADDNLHEIIPQA